jgi:hypothetical protein
MSEEVLEVPETAEGGSYMGAGMHLVKIHSIEVAKDDNGNPKRDKNGNPALKFVFENRASESISQIYYYSPLPVNHPDRLDDNKRCKSEFKLTQLKKAFGFGNKAITTEELKTKKCWMAVRQTNYEDAAGNPIVKDGKQKSYCSIAEVFPLKEATATDPSKGRPVLKGDPETDPAGFLKGFFYEVKIDVAPMSSSIKDDSYETDNSAIPAGEQAVSNSDVTAETKPEADW